MRAGRAAERLQEETGAKNGKVATKASTIHRLLNYKSWSQRRLGGDDASAEVHPSPISHAPLLCVL